MCSNNWPAPLSDDAYHGIAGEFVRLVEPETEADRNILLIHFLVFAGNIFGRRAWFEVSGQRHHSNVLLAIVGASSYARKGTASAPIQLFFNEADRLWTKNKVKSGLSSGEGFMEEIRDARYEMINTAKKGGPDRFEEKLTDPGIADKRLMILEGELAGPLQSMKRDGNKLSVIIRLAFDGSNLGNLTKKDKTTVTSPHISLVANITQQELQKLLLTTEMFNGFANRFMWALAQRSKRLPEDGQLLEVAQGDEFRSLVRRFAGINGVYRGGTAGIEHPDYLPETRPQPDDPGGGSTVEGKVRLSEEAQDTWGRNGDDDSGMYRDLEPTKHGMHGTVTHRAAVITRRLALIYALLDGCSEIAVRHLIAAREVWRYCDDSARLIFNGEEDLGNPVANKIYAALQQAPNHTLGSTEISRRLFNGHLEAAAIQEAQEVLIGSGKVTVLLVPASKARVWKLRNAA